MLDLQSELPDEDFAQIIKAAIRETRQTITEAQTQTANAAALQAIDKAIDDIEFEVRYLTGTLERQRQIIAQLYAQRNRAIRERDMVMSRVVKAETRRE